MTPFSWTIFAFAAAGALYWIMLFVRIARALPAIPRVEDADAMSEASGKISIVIPAHNECRVIAASVRGLRAQVGVDFEAIYVLDRCTDDTRALLIAAAEGDPRIRFVENAHCPDDWAGKCFAASVGAAEAKGDWILFTDADCRFGETLVRSMLRIAMQRQTALLSALGRLTFGRSFERQLQPVATMVLMRIFPLDKANREERCWPFANGQFLLFKREAYESIGGHAIVKDDLLEDLAFAKRLHEAGRRIGVVDAGTRMQVSMYDSPLAMRRGWTRIFIESCGRRPRTLRWKALEFFTTGVVLPLVACASMIASGYYEDDIGASAILFLTGALSLGSMVVTLSWMHGLFHAPYRGICFHPYAAFTVARWLLDGARILEKREAVRWGGREYVLEPR
ncbi:MAG: glycosyltransferase [Phycisphaerales bacterium]|nr:glycosyltransferase [Phycisphaerales bacterium]